MCTADDAAWWMFSYKVQPCPIQERHDWSTCPNAHRGERAARRCPRTYSYTPEPCPEYNKTGSCGQGVGCPLAHSVFESWLHPSRFRTQLCCFGSSCKRRICFFAHDPSQLRAATHTPNSAAAAVAAAAAGAPVLRRTQAVVPATMMVPGLAAGASSSRQQTPTPPQQQQGRPATLPAAGSALQPPRPAVQQVASMGMPAPGPSWVYTAAGWVQAGPGLGGPMLVPVAPMMGAMQGQVMAAPVPSAALQQGAVPGPALVPMDPSMLSGLAAGLSAMSLQEPAELSNSGQSYACMPGTLLPSSPATGLLYSQGSGAYAQQAQVQAQLTGASPNAAAGLTSVYTPAPVAMGVVGSVVDPTAQQQQQQQQAVLIGPVGSLTPGMPGGGAQGPNSRTQQQWR